MKKIYKTFVVAMALAGAVATTAATRNLEWLDRGLVAVNTGGSNVYLSWRLLATEWKTASFNIYRDGAKIATVPATGATNYSDNSGSATAKYSVRAVVGGVEESAGTPVTPWKNQWLSIPFQAPAGGTTKAGIAYSYIPSDASVADLDGDGRYEVVVKLDAVKSGTDTGLGQDNSQPGYTPPVVLQAYTLDGKLLWSIDLGINIRMGAHYTQFQVYDYDGDGKAELIVKTAPGTKDGTGAYLSTGSAAGADNTKDYRNSSGYILSGPEWLTLFDGATGKELNTVDYLPGRGTVSAWGDSYGNRVDRFLAYTAWLDGVHPSAVFQRGYYTRTALTAWDVSNKKLVKKWAYDRPLPSGDKGQGNHNGTVASVSGDGKDEIFLGSSAVASDGTLFWDNQWGHGDAMHLGAMDPDLGGKQIWAVKEDSMASVLCDAKTGKTLWSIPATSDVGRGMAADIDSVHKGYEVWSSATSGVYDIKGKKISSNLPSDNFRIYWDGDLYDEVLDGTKLDKWNGNGTTRLFTFYNYPAGDGVATNNGTKSTPCLVADIFGDWREEVVYRTARNDSLIIFTTTIPTTHRMYTPMHDPEYRAAIAWQNGAYNQPPHLSFLLSDTVHWPTPDVNLIGKPAISPVEISASSGRLAALSSQSMFQFVGQNSIALPQGMDERTGLFEVRDLRGRLCAKVALQEGRLVLPAGMVHGIYLLRTVRN